MKVLDKYDIAAMAWAEMTHQQREGAAARVQVITRESFDDYSPITKYYLEKEIHRSVTQ